MSERVALNVKISRRAKITLDAHANLWRGTAKGSASAIIECLINDHLREIRISHHAIDDESDERVSGAA